VSHQLTGREKPTGNVAAPVAPDIEGILVGSPELVISDPVLHPLGPRDKATEINEQGPRAVEDHIEPVAILELPPIRVSKGIHLQNACSRIPQHPEAPLVGIGDIGQEGLL
jgi:hypothetical protein